MAQNWTDKDSFEIDGGFVYRGCSRVSSKGVCSPECARICGLGTSPLTPQEWPPDISVKKTLVCPSEIDHEIRTVWGQWFHRDNDHTCWTDAMIYVDSMPEHVPMPYVPFSVDKWTHMLKGVSTKSARGSCGFSVQELKLIPDALLQALFDLFHAMKDDHSWPEALVFVMVMCLPKVEGPCTALQIRPITVLSRLYRCWARFRSSEIVEWLSSKLLPTLAGGVKCMSVTDINTIVANYLEPSFGQDLSRVGGIFDIIKCFTQGTYPVLDDSAGLFKARLVLPRIVKRGFPKVAACPSS